jgi:hypothetical protein
MGGSARVTAGASARARPNGIPRGERIAKGATDTMARLTLSTAAEDRGL